MKDQIEKINTTFLLGALIHDKKLSKEIKKLIEQELKKRGAICS